MSSTDYERFLRELEDILERMGAVNVAGIEQGIVDELTERTRDLIGLKFKARFIGSRKKLGE